LSKKKKKKSTEKKTKTMGTFKRKSGDGLTSKGELERTTTLRQFYRKKRKGRGF